MKTASVSALRRAVAGGLLLAFALAPVARAQQPAGARRGSEAWLLRMLPESGDLPGFRLSGGSGARNTNPTTRFRVFTRDRDHLTLEFEVHHHSMRQWLKDRMDEVWTGRERPSRAAFSGLPFGEAVLATPRPHRSPIVLAVREGDWVLIARAVYADARRSAPPELLLQMEWLLREPLSRVAEEAAQVATARYGRNRPVAPYFIAGRPAEGLKRGPGGWYAPVKPLLEAAGLRAMTDRLPVVRGYRGNELVVTVAAAAREMRVRGRSVRVPQGGMCWEEDGALYVPVTELAPHLGLATYFVGRTPELHVALPNARRPHGVAGLRLPPGFAAAGPVRR